MPIPHDRAIDVMRTRSKTLIDLAKSLYPFSKILLFIFLQKRNMIKYRNSGYEIYDPAGNNLGQLDNQRSWIKIYH